MQKKAIEQYRPKLFMTIDPGGTTGLAVGWHDGSFEFTLASSSEISWSDRAIIYDLILREELEARKTGRQFVVYCEDFKPDKGAIAALADRHVLASEVIGMADLTCQRNGILFLRSPRWAKSNVTVLPRHRVMVGQSPHRNDAYKHLRYHIIEDVQKYKRFMRGVK